MICGRSQGSKPGIAGSKYRTRKSMMDRGKMGGKTRGWSAHRISREPFPSLSVATRKRHTGDVDGPHIVVVPLVRPDLAAKAVGDYGPPSRQGFFIPALDRFRYIDGG